MLILLLTIFISFISSESLAERSVAIVISGPAVAPDDTYNQVPEYLAEGVFETTSKGAIDGFYALGFHRVIDLTQPSREELEAALSRIKLEQDEISNLAIYFIGHGVQQKGDTSLLMATSFKWYDKTEARHYHLSHSPDRIMGNELNEILSTYLKY